MKQKILLAYDLHHIKLQTFVYCAFHSHTNSKTELLTNNRVLIPFHSIIITTYNP